MRKNIGFSNMKKNCFWKYVKQIFERNEIRKKCVPSESVNKLCM